MSEFTTFLERNIVLDMLPPISASSAANGSWVSVAGYQEIVVLVLVGATAATATFDLDVNQATSAAGAGAKNLTDSAAADMDITQLTDADDDVYIGIIIRPEFLDVGGGFGFIRVTATPATAAVLYGVLVMGVLAYSKPVVTTGWEEVIGP